MVLGDEAVVVCEDKYNEQTANYKHHLSYP